MGKRRRGRRGQKRMFQKTEANESSGKSAGLLLLASAARNLDYRSQSPDISLAFAVTANGSDCYRESPESDESERECENENFSKSKLNESDEDEDVDIETLAQPPQELVLVFKLVEDNILTTLFKARGSVCTGCNSKRSVDEMVICSCNCFVDSFVCLKCFLYDCSCSTSTDIASMSVSETSKKSSACMSMSTCDTGGIKEAGTATNNNLVENCWTSDIELAGVPFELEMQILSYEQITYETGTEEAEESQLLRLRQAD